MNLIYPCRRNQINDKGFFILTFSIFFCCVKTQSTLNYAHQPMGVKGVLILVKCVIKAATVSDNRLIRQ
jgi:hypothetical protein